MRKWKWLFVNNGKYENPVSTVAEFLNSHQGEINASERKRECGYVEK
jgi:hypothetical protein